VTKPALRSKNLKDWMTLDFNKLNTKHWLSKSDAILQECLKRAPIGLKMFNLGFFELF
jgi:hypothetical protein